MQTGSFLEVVKKHRLFVLVFVVVIVGAGYMLVNQLNRPTGFRIVTTNPRLNEITSLAPFLKIYLSEPTTKEGVSIPSQPVIKSYEVSSKAITIYLNALDRGKRYTIAIDSIRSTQGTVLNNQRLSFTPKEGSWEKLPQDQKEVVLKDQDVKPASSSDPILVALPHQTPDYIMNALIDGSELRLTVKITPSFADTLDDGTTDPDAYERYKKEALDYIRSLHLDPANYKIEFSTVNPYSE